jgi:hypothetical protein
MQSSFSNFLSAKPKEPIWPGKFFMAKLIRMAISRWQVVDAG